MPHNNLIAPGGTAFEVYEPGIASAEPPPPSANDYGWAANGDVGHAANGRADKPGLPLKFWGDLDSVALPDRLVKRLLGTGSLCVITGEPACGKSFLATDLAIHIALGWAWFGRPVTSGSVLLVAGEGVAGISNRLAAYRKRHELPAEVAFVVVPVAANLGPEGQDAQKVIDAASIIEARTGKALQLVIVDTLARSMGAGDENSAQDMGAFIGACDRIRIGTGATVLIIHHRGKSQAGARGSSALMGAVDTAIEVERRDDGRVAKVTKQKDGADGEELGFDLVVVEIGSDEDGEPITTCIVQPSDEIAKAAPKLSPKHKRALDVLRNVLIDFPEERPNSVTLPDCYSDQGRALQKGLEIGGRNRP